MKRAVDASSFLRLERLARIHIGRTWNNASLRPRTFSQFAENHLNNSGQKVVKRGPENPKFEALKEQASDLLNTNTILRVDDSRMWEDAEQMMISCLRAAKVTDLEKVDYCTRILDRLVGVMPKSEMMFASMMSTELLNDIVLKWRTGISRTRSGRFRKKLSPWVMAEKVDNYRLSSLVQPDSKTFNIILDGSYLYSSQQEGIQFADSLLHKLIEVSKESENHQLVNSISFGTIMNAWARKRQPERVQEWFRIMLDLYKENGWTDLKPTSIVYSIAITAWGRVGHAEQAEAMFQELLLAYDHGNESCEPDSITFNAVLNAWAQSGSREAVDRAESLLEHMEQLSARGLDCIPDNYTYSNVIKCWADSEKGPEAAEKRLAELQPIMSERSAHSTVTYNSILHAYAKMGMAEEAEGLLRHVIQSEVVEPDETSFNTVIMAWSKKKTPDAPLQAEALLAFMNDLGISPSNFTYSSVMQAWVNSRRPDAPDRIEELLHDMCALYKSGDNPDILPNTICYNIALKAWGSVARGSRAPQALARVASLLDQILQDPSLKPSDVTFRTVLHGIANSTAPNKPERAQVVLELMKRHGIEPSKRDEKLMRRLANRAKEIKT